jgi:hypothetical protein
VRHIQNNKLCCDKSIISIKVGEIGKAKDLPAPLRIPIETDGTVHVAVVPLEGGNGNMRDEEFGDDIVAKNRRNQGFPFCVCDELDAHDCGCPMVRP